MTFKQTVDDVFLKHPRDVNEHYLEHLLYTVKVAFYLIFTALCAVLHGLCPKILVTTTSDRVIALADKMKEKRKLLQASLDQQKL